MAESLGFNIKIIDTYKGAKDPAEIIAENPDNWKDSLEKARAIMDYYFDSAFAGFDKNLPEGKKEIGKIILPAIKRLQSKIEQSYWAQKLAEKLGVKEEAVLEELKNINIKTDSNYSNVLENTRIVEAKNSSSAGRKKLIENKIIALAIKNPENLGLIEESHRNLFTDKVASFLDELKKNAGQEAVLNELSEKPEHKEFFDSFALLADVEYAEDSYQEIQLCLSELKGIELRNSLNNILNQIKQENDEIKKEELVKRFDKIAKELHQKA